MNQEKKCEVSQNACTDTKCVDHYHNHTPQDSEISEQIDIRISEIMRLADKGDDEAYSKRAAELAIYIHNLIQKVQEEAYQRGRDDYWKQVTEEGVYNITRTETIKEAIEIIGKMEGARICCDDFKDEVITKLKENYG